MLFYLIAAYPGDLGDNISITEDMISEMDERRLKASTQSYEPDEISDKKKEAYIDLIMQMDQYEDEREARYAQNNQEGIDFTNSQLLAATLKSGGHLQFLHDGMDLLISTDHCCCCLFAVITLVCLYCFCDNS